MELEQIMVLCKKTDDAEYAKFLTDLGWKYDAEEDAVAGYSRMVKSLNGTPLSVEEFLEELQAEGDTSTQRQLYDTLLGYVEKGALVPRDLYMYAKYRWCVNRPEAVVAYQIGPKHWSVNNCAESISEEQAKLLINSEFGFEASRIKLLDIPYYDATDWNFIGFRCGPYDWLMRDGDLYQLYQ